MRKTWLLSLALLAGCNDGPTAEEQAASDARDVASDWWTAADAWASATPMHYLEGYARWRAGRRILETRGAEARAAARSQLTRALEIDRKSTRLNSSHVTTSRMPSSA